ncbi:MAG: hypothetical protein ACE5OQ_13220 [Woeseia sp.]
MKALGIISLFFLFGCAPSTQDLIEEAHLTGDWTHVNKRIEAIERREAKKTMMCPDGSTRWCDSRFGDDRCACVRNSEVRAMLRSLGL